MWVNGSVGVWLGVGRTLGWSLQALVHVCQGWHGLEMMDPVALPPSPLLDNIPPEVLNDHDGIRSCMECSATGLSFFLVLISDLWPLR